MNVFGRILVLLIFLSFVGINIACTRKQDGSAVLKLTLKKSTEVSSSKIKPLPLLDGPNAYNSLNWNGDLSPTSTNDINCYAVFVGGPDAAFNQNSCTAGVAKTPVVDFGPFAGFVSLGQELSLSVPSGADRTIYLVGVQANTSTSCFDIHRPPSVPSFDQLSTPQILDQVTMDLEPGEIRVEMTPEMASSQTFDDCNIFDSGSDSTTDSTLQLIGSGTIDSAVLDFQRPSVGTFYDASRILRIANTGLPRFDHNPDTGAYRGLLIERGSTNYITFSTEFNNTDWTYYSGATVATTGVVQDPMGTAEARQVTDSQTAGYSFLGHSMAATASLPYTFSFYARGNTSQVVDVVMTDDMSNCGSIEVDLVGLQAQATTNCATQSVDSFGVEQIGGNGWARIWMTFTVGAGAGTIDTNVYPSYRPSYGAGADATLTTGIFVWGAQLEQGSGPTSYIPTSGGFGTRSSDTLDAINFSWFVNGPMAFSMVAMPAPEIGTPTVETLFSFGLDNNNYTNFRYSGSDTQLNVFVGGTASGSPLTNNLTWGAFQKKHFAVAIEPANYALSEGDSQVFSTVITEQTLNPAFFYIGRNRLGADNFTGWIESMDYYDYRVPNSELLGL